MTMRKTGQPGSWEGKLASLNSKVPEADWESGD
jgi:hypothetical protein